MRFRNLFASLRKPKIAPTEQAPNLADRSQIQPTPHKQPFITPPAPVASTRSRCSRNTPAFTYQITEVENLQRSAHAAPCVQPINFADLDEQGDLGLQGSTRFTHGLLEVEPTTSRDSGYSANRQLALTCVPGGSFGNKVQNLHPLPSDKLGSPVRAPRVASGGLHVYVGVASEGGGIDVTGIRGSVGPRARGGRERRPGGQLDSISELRRIPIPSQMSEVTLCGSFASTGEYKVADSNFQNDCTFVRDIGEGGFGKVELHKHNKSKELVVLKRARLSREYIKGQPAEVYILRDIVGKRHDRLPKLYHVNTSLAEIHIWQDYCDGGDLQEFGQYFTDHKRLIPEGFLWHVLTQLSAALAYLHTGLLDRSNPELQTPASWQPVVHRDVKPDNIFLKLLPTEKNLYPNIVLGDFGLATTKLNTGSQGRYLGTPCWQGPEIPVHTIHSDIWSAGGIVHYLALGAPPLKVVPEGYPFEPKWWEFDPMARYVHDVRQKGYSEQLHEAVREWLNWEERKRPAGLRGVLRAEAGQLMFLAEGGLQESLGGWWGWIRRGGTRQLAKTGKGAKGFED
ncbi:MAG: hypothetical protein LQ345_004123 [Seirophora villosa]|nr:MAG: hypothetical protein LQ345_004123 [Seirophora villosa]